MYCDFRRVRSAGAVAIVLSFNLLSDRAAAADSAAAEAADSAGISEVVVTARKREERLIDTPVDVQVMSGQELSRSGTTNLVALSSQIPQLNVLTFPGNGGAIFAIRGIGSPATDGGLEQTVSTVFDGVQMSRGWITQLGFFDVQSVQVLKGPQALFFGKNSPAGVVSVTSTAPSSQWEGYARQGYEFDAQQASAEGAISGPVTDTFKIRLAAKYDRMLGYLTNDARPLTVPNIFASRGPAFPATVAFAGGANTSNPTDTNLLGRLTLEWDPTDRFHALFHALAGHLRGGDPGGSQENLCAGGPNAQERTLGVLVPTGHCALGDHNSLNVNPLMFAQSLPWSTAERKPYQSFTGNLDSLELNYDAGPVRVAAITGYARYVEQLVGGKDASFSLLSAGQEYVYTQISQELRVNTNFELPVNFAAGVLYEKQHHNYTGVVDVGLGLFPADPATGRYDSLNSKAYTQGDTESPFAQAIWKISPAWEFDAGARWTRESRQADEYNTFLNKYSLLSGIAPVGQIVSGKQNFYNTSPEATLTWHPADEAMVYAAFKTGYKSGGYSMQATLPATATGNSLLFRPEKSSGGEIGGKARALDGRLQVTGAAYYYRFRDLQQSIYNAQTTTFIVQNAAVATTKGVESSLTWQPLPSLSLTADLSYNQGRFRSYPNSPCWGGQSANTCSKKPGAAAASQDLSGTRLPYSSDWVERVGFNWEHGLPIGTDYRFALGGNAQYMSPFNSSATDNPVAAFGPQVLVDAHIDIFPQSERWTLSVIGNNLLDKRYLMIAVDRPGGTLANGAQDVIGSPNRSRSLWVQLTERF